MAINFKVMFENKVLRFIIGLAVTISLLVPIGYILIDQPSIHEATFDELIEIDDIGEVLANRVLLYLEENPQATINDLIEVEGIGRKRLHEIEKEFD